VFTPEKRAFYGLERLRKSATSLSIADLNAELKQQITSTRKKNAVKKPAKKTAPKKAAAKKVSAVNASAVKATKKPAAKKKLGAAAKKKRSR